MLIEASFDVFDLFCVSRILNMLITFYFLYRFTAGGGGGGGGSWLGLIR